MDKYRVYFMPDAIKDLEDIYLYIVEQSGFPERAWNYEFNIARSIATGNAELSFLRRGETTIFSESH